MERRLGTLPEKTAADLRQKIGAGEYQGQLPTIDQLAQEYHISRMTMIAAVRALQNEGLIETRQGRGTFVAGTMGSAKRPRTPSIDSLPSETQSEPLALKDIWKSLDMYLWTQQRVAQLNYLQNPTDQNRDRFNELLGRYTVCNKLADLIHQEPDNPILRTGIISLFRREISNIEGRTLGEALRDIK